MALIKTVKHYWCVLRMGRKAVGIVFCVMYVKEASALFITERYFTSLLYRILYKISLLKEGVHPGFVWCG